MQWIYTGRMQVIRSMQQRLEKAYTARDNRDIEEFMLEQDTHRWNIEKGNKNWNK
jgi:hypothetical protein